MPTISTPSSAYTKVITVPEGVQERLATVVVARQKSSVAVPPTYQGTAYAYPADEFCGAGFAHSVLHFNTSVTSQLIKTEDYGNGITHWFNNGAAKPCQCAYFHDFAVDGQAGFHNYPYVNILDPSPDPHGPDFVERADGIAVMGNGTRVERVLMFQIPGTAIKIVDGSGTQAGAQGIFDSVTTRVVDVFVAFAYHGIEITISDSQVCRANVENIAKDAIIINGGGTSVSDCHTWGSDRGCVLNAAANLSNNYFEAARIGLEIASAAVGSKVIGHEIGPATCYEKGILVTANKCTLLGVSGTIKTDTVGVDIDGVSTVLQADLQAQPDATLVQVQGSRQKIDLHTGWGEHDATAVEVTASLTHSEINITGSSAGGTMLDLSASGLNSTNGGGNVFRVTWSDWVGGATPVVYPGGGTTYNLAAGNYVYVNGVLQS